MSINANQSSVLLFWGAAFLFGYLLREARKAKRTPKRGVYDDL